jgi:hypothetical protein
LANFLDRIAYKEAKSEEKLKVFRQKQARMSEYLEPINNAIREKLNGISKIQVREEEKFMWKYLEEKQIK